MLVSSVLICFFILKRGNCCWEIVEDFELLHNYASHTLFWEEDMSKEKCKTAVSSKVTIS